MLMRISRNISIEMELTDIVWSEEELMNILSNSRDFVYLPSHVHDSREVELCL